VLPRDGEGLELTIVRARIWPRAADLEVAINHARLLVTATGTLSVLDFAKGAPVAVGAFSGNEFFVDGGDHTHLAFPRDGTVPTMRLVFNPGPLADHGSADQLTGEHRTHLGNGGMSISMIGALVIGVKLDLTILFSLRSRLAHGYPRTAVTVHIG
jgi:hypothetical protein